jgi:hypothetical protein
MSVRLFEHAGHRNRIAILVGLCGDSEEGFLLFQKLADFF